MHTISDLVIIAGDLYSADLISESTRTRANTETSTSESRNYDILDELMSGVALDPTKLLKIISVLECHPPNLSSIAEKMKTKICNKTRVTLNIVVDVFDHNQLRFTW